MDEKELIREREKIEPRLKEEDLGEKCVKIAQKLGQDKGSFQGPFNTCLDYLYKDSKIEIDCDIGVNMQGAGMLKVMHYGKEVFIISNNYPYDFLREDLPHVTANYVPHNVILYEPGEWESRIEELARQL